MICLGIDQDLHNTGLALLQGFTSLDSPIVLDLDVVSVTGNDPDATVLKMIAALKAEISVFINLHKVDLCVIEGVQKYYGTSPAKVEDLIRGAYISGAAAAYCWQQNPECFCIVNPNEWKGSIPKNIHQERLYNFLGWKPKRIKSHSYPKEPPEEFKFSSEEWKHIGDGIGLAWWGLRRKLEGRI